MNLINFSGCECAWCFQPVTDQSYGPQAKEIRTETIKIAYPWAVKDKTNETQEESQEKSM